MSVRGLFLNAKSQLQLAPGEVVFAEDDLGDSMFGVIEGAVELRRGGVVVARVGPEEVFGEMALIDGSPRSLTATASADTTLAVIDRRLFLFLIHETPTFALEVMASMASRLRLLNDQLVAP